MTRTLHFIAFTALLCTTSACATVITSGKNDIKVSTTPPTQSTCRLANARGAWSGPSDVSTTVKRSRTDLDVTCTDPLTGTTGKTVVESGVEPWAFGNIIVGGLIGLGVDWATGSAYDYPEDVRVALRDAIVSEPSASSVSAPSAPSAPAMSASPAPAFAPAPAAAPAQTAVPVASPVGSQGATGSIAAPPVFVPPSY